MTGVFDFMTKKDEEAILVTDVELIKAVGVIIFEPMYLFPEQKRIINEKYGSHSIIDIPSIGISKEEMEEMQSSFYKYYNKIIFVPPVLNAVAYLYKLCVKSHLKKPDFYPEPLIFHNPNRKWKESSNGKKIPVTCPTGWELI